MGKNQQKLLSFFLRDALGQSFLTPYRYINMVTASVINLKVGQSACVTGYSKQEGSKAYRQKLLAMGLTRGTQFTVTRVAPMGDPIEIKVRGFSLSLRKAEATALQIELVAD